MEVVLDVSTLQEIESSVTDFVNHPYERLYGNGRQSKISDVLVKLVIIFMFS